MSRVPLIVVGAGGHGRVVADAAQAAGFDVLAFADDSRRGQRVAGCEVMPGDAAEVARRAQATGAVTVVAIGDNLVRERVQQALVLSGAALGIVVHPRAVVSESARIAPGSVVLAQALIGVDAVLGEGVIVNHGASLDHDGSLADFVHLSPGVHLGGQVVVGRSAHLAVGVSVRNGITIGARSVVGVGAAVVSDLPDDVVAYGVPARVVRQGPA